LDLQFAKAVTTDTPAIARACLFDVPLDSPNDCRLGRDLPGMVKVAREFAGKMDMTSVSACTNVLERSPEGKNSKDSIDTANSNYVSLGQNSKRFGSLDRSTGRGNLGHVSNRKKQISSQPLTSDPLSFAWGFLETKK